MVVLHHRHHRHRQLQAGSSFTAMVSRQLFHRSGASRVQATTACGSCEGVGPLCDQGRALRAGRAALNHVV